MQGKEVWVRRGSVSEEGWWCGGVGGSVTTIGGEEKGGEKSKGPQRTS